MPRRTVSHLSARRLIANAWYFYNEINEMAINGSSNPPHHFALYLRDSFIPAVREIGGINLSASSRTTLDSLERRALADIKKYGCISS